MKKWLQGIVLGALFSIVLFGATATVMATETGAGTADEVVSDSEASVKSAVNVDSSGTCGENLNWVLYDDGLLVITGTGEMEDYDYPSDRPHWDISKIKNIVFPEGLTSIGDLAFAYCSGLTGSLELPDSLTSIGSHAFTSCSGLTGSLKLPGGLTSIGDYAFAYCSSLTGSLELSDNLTSIGSHAFSECSGFTGSLELPEGLTLIEKCTFWECSGLTGSLKLPSSLTSIGEDAFYKCSSLTGSLELPSSLTSIGEGAFCGCSGLTGSLKLPKGVTSIESNAFQECSGLSGSLELPSGLTNIGKFAFSKCSGLTGTLELPESLISIGEGAFLDCSGLTGDLKLPSNLISVGGSAFGGCSSLAESLELPSSLTSIGEYVFNGCWGLTQLILSEGCKSIPKSVITSSLTKLQSIVIPKSVTFIGEDEPGFLQNLTIYCYNGSAAHSFAEHNGLTYILLDAPTECKHTHTSVSGKKAATCTKTGYTGDTVCKDCGEVIKKGKAIAKKAHTYESKKKVVKATPKKNGSITGTCKVCKKDVKTTIYAPKKVSLSKTSYVYDGKAKKPTVTVTDKKGKKISKAGYTVSYSANKNAGQAKVTVKFKGNYSGSMVKTFEI